MNTKNKILGGFVVGYIGGCFILGRQLTRKGCIGLIEDSKPWAKVEKKALETFWILLKKKPINGESWEYLADMYQEDYDTLIAKLDEIINFEYNWKISTLKLYKLSNTKVFEEVSNLFKNINELIQEYSLAD